METNSFQFKQFNINQNKSAFKVGTDSVILGSWVDPTGTTQILDIGTGSGILALMMAQKSSAKITGIDIEIGAFEQAKENSENSPWQNRINIEHSSVQNFALNFSTPHYFDIIISNPPYFQSKKHATGTPKSTARNSDTLPFSDLIKASLKLLSESGKLCVVLPTTQAKEFRRIAEKSGLVLSKLLRVQTKEGKSFEKRHLMQFERTSFHFLEEVLIIEENEHLNFTYQYKKLTKDFYLAF